MNKLMALCAILTLGACDDLFSTTVDFGDDAAASVDLSFDISGDCTDTGTRTDALGVTTWVEHVVGEGETATCQIDVTWDGDLISLAKMRADTVDECGADNDKCNPDDLDLTLIVTLQDAFFTAGAERLDRPQLAALTARATTNGAELFKLDRDTALPVQLAANPDVKAQLKAAYLSGGSLPVHAESSLALTMAEVRRLQVGSPTGTLSVAFMSHLAGSIAAHL